MPKHAVVPTVAAEFNVLNPNWSKFPEYNLTFLRNNEARFDRIVKEDGHVFLNDVYSALGMPHTYEGSRTGWYKKIREDVLKQHIDFGIDTSDIRDGVIRLNFNVDGDLLKLL